MTTLAIFKNISGSALTLGMGLTPFCPEVGIPLSLVAGVASFIMGFFGSSDDQAGETIGEVQSNIEADIKAVTARVKDDIDQDFENSYLASVTGIQSGLANIFSSFQSKQSDGTLTWNSVNAISNIPYYEATIRGQFVGSDDAIFGLNSPLVNAVNFAKAQDDGSHKPLDLVLNAVMVYITAGKLFAVLEHWNHCKTWMATGEKGAVPVAKDDFVAADSTTYLSKNLTDMMNWITPIVTKINNDQLQRANAANAAANAAAQAAPPDSLTGGIMDFNSSYPLAMLKRAEARGASFDQNTTIDLTYLTTPDVIFAMNDVYNKLAAAQADYMTNVMGQADFPTPQTFPTAAPTG